MKTWHLLLIGGGVLYVLMEREKQKVKIAANDRATDIVNATGRGVVKVIDESAGALGSFLSNLLKPSNTPSSSTSSGTTASYTPDGYSSWDDYYDYGDI